MSVYNKSGNAVSAVFGSGGRRVSEAYSYDGTLVYTDATDYDNYTISSMFSLSGSGFQSFSVHDGIIAQIIANDKIRFVDLKTHEVLVPSVNVSVGHGNSCQFSQTFLFDGDEFPLLWSTDTYRRVYINHITRTGSTLLKTYYFDVNLSGYILGIGVNEDENLLYTVGYTYQDYESDRGGTNKVHTSIWDLTQETDNGDGAYSLARLSTNAIDFFPCIQGSCYHDGYIFVSSGLNGNQARIFLINPTTGQIEHTITIGNTIEMEGCAWVDNDYLIAGQSPNNITYKKIKFDSVLM